MIILANIANVYECSTSTQNCQDSTNTHIHRWSDTPDCWVLCTCSCPDDQTLTAQSQQDRFIQVSRQCAPTPSLLMCPQLNRDVNKSMQLRTFVWGAHTRQTLQMYALCPPHAQPNPNPCPSLYIHGGWVQLLRIICLWKGACVSPYGMRCCLHVHEFVCVHVLLIMTRTNKNLHLLLPI